MALLDYIPFIPFIPLVPQREIACLPACLVAPPGFNGALRYVLSVDASLMGTPRASIGVLPISPRDRGRFLPQSGLAVVLVNHRTPLFTFPPRVISDIRDLTCICMVYPRVRETQKY